MGFYIKYQEMQEYCRQTERWMTTVTSVLARIQKSMLGLKNEEGMKGAAADSIKAYIEEFHLPVINGIQVLITDLYSKMLLYIDDYYTYIDASPQTVLCEDALTEYIEQMHGDMQELEDYQQEIETIVNSISDFCDIRKPNLENLRDINHCLTCRIQQLAEDVTEMEQRHLHDLDGAEELLQSLNQMIARHCWKTNQVNGDFEIGSIRKSEEFIGLSNIYKQELRALSGVEKTISTLQKKELQEKVDGEIFVGQKMPIKMSSTVGGKIENVSSAVEVSYKEDVDDQISEEDGVLYQIIENIQVFISAMIAEIMEKTKEWLQLVSENENTVEEEKNSVIGLGKEGYQLLIHLELGVDLSNLDYIKLDDEGNIVAIRNHMVGDGGVTVGFGIYVNDTYHERIEMLQELGIDWEDTTQWVPIATVEQAFGNISGQYEKYVDDIISKYGLSVSQSQYDALFIMAYNRPALFMEGGAVDQMLSSNNCNISDWRKAIMDEYRQLDRWEDYKYGWTNRIEDLLELYFYGDYERTH